MSSRTVPLTIFRRAAAHHHHHGQSEGVLPEFLQHRLLGRLWLSSALALGLVAAAWAQRTPRVVAATGFFAPATADGTAGAALLLTVPGANPALAAGQRLVCVAEDGVRLGGAVVNVVANPTTLEEARARFALGPAPGAPLRQPLRIAHGRLDGGELARDFVASRGGCNVLIEIGLRPLYSFLPLPEWLLSSEARGE